VDFVRLRIRDRDRLLHQAKRSISAGAEDMLARCGRQHVAGEHQLDRQQVLEQAQCDVGFVDA